MILNYRKGTATGSGVMYFIFFLIVIIIVGGIIGGIIAFFGKGYDYRQTEARDLMIKVKECFAKENFIVSELKPENFYDKCYISKKVIEDGKHIIYVKDKSNQNEFSVGVDDFKTRCGLNARFKNKGLPLCTSDSFSSDKYDFLVGSSQNSKRVIA